MTKEMAPKRHCNGDRNDAVWKKNRNMEVVITEAKNTSFWHVEVNPSLGLLVGGGEKPQRVTTQVSNHKIWPTYVKTFQI